MFIFEYYISRENYKADQYALMIQLVKFVGGGVVVVVVGWLTPTTYIQLAGAGSTKSINVKTVKRSNKWFQALHLSVVANINHRSVYSKVDEFHTFVKEKKVDLIFMSESCEREHLKLDQIIHLVRI